MQIKNTENSSLKQMLIDLEKVLLSEKTDVRDALKAFYNLVKELNLIPKIYPKTDFIFNRHKYNDKKMHFTKLANYKNLQIVVDLTGNAIKVLFYMIQVMGQENKISVKMKNTSKELRLSLNTFKKCLEELEKNGCITKIADNKKDGTIYMVNPEIANNSKHEKKLLDEFEKITLDKYYNNFQMLGYSNKSSVLTTKGMIDGTPISFNHTEIVQLDDNTKRAIKQAQQQNYIDKSIDFDYSDEEVDNLFSVNG